MFLLINILAKVLFQKYVFLFATSLIEISYWVYWNCIYFLFSAFDMHSMSFLIILKSCELCNLLYLDEGQWTSCGLLGTSKLRHRKRQSWKMFTSNPDHDPLINVWCLIYAVEWYFYFKYFFGIIIVLGTACFAPNRQRVYKAPSKQETLSTFVRVWSKWNRNSNGNVTVYP